MGAWGIKNFENDGAADFVADVLSGNKLIIANTIEKILEISKGDYLEVCDCEEALAAVEFVAAAKGNPSSDISAEALNWVKTSNLLHFKDFDLVSSSKKVIDRILSHSEIKELWEEANEFMEWEKIILDLKTRIG